MKIVLVLAALSTGCFVVPKTTTTTRDLGTTEGDLVYGDATGYELTGRTTPDLVVVRAIARHTCTREVLAVTEIKKEKHARMGGATDPRARALLGGPLAVLTVPISAAVTGLVVLADGDGKTERRAEVVRVEREPCSQTAVRTPLEIAWPSGTKERVDTDANGKAALRIADTEPYRGVARVTAPRGPAVEVAYARKMPPVTALREAVLACAAAGGLAGKATIEVEVGPWGKPARIGADIGDGTFTACIARELETTRFATTHRNATLVLPLELPQRDDSPIGVDARRTSRQPFAP